MREYHQDEIEIELGKAPQDKWKLDAKSKLWLPRNKAPIELQDISPGLEDYFREEKKKSDQVFDIIRAGSIAISAIIIQGFLSAGATDGNAVGAVIFLALSIPMVATAILLNHKRESDSKRMQVADTLGLATTGAGILLTFFHISYYAGLVFLFSAMAGLFMFIGDD